MDLYALTRPLFFALSPETAHGLVIRLLKAGLVPAQGGGDDAALGISLWGLNFSNPLGLAAGFDKNAEVPDAMLAQGFGFVETGTVTPRPQPGNPKPRLFRLTEDEAIINRLGFNNKGLQRYAANLERRRLLAKEGIVGANIGANKDSEDPIADYVTGLERLLGLADYFTVNISSPNTPGLRKLQGREALDELLSRLMTVRNHAREKLSYLPPLLVKIAPDLDDKERSDIAEIILKHGIDGLIVSNTTVGLRDQLKSSFREETGGLSGQPLFEFSTQVLEDMYRLTEGRIPLIGVGGVSTGQQAYAKIRAGASLIQLYSALAYHGPGLVQKIKRELLACLREDGFSSVMEAVGAAHR
ncbi:quinone-dependent dihydroorotate dehydrogenase [Luteithermobacter gelatinilyticus]|uniref:quinone-dependent dihydroorotate dehydrogenase n=1 Tax=Luteithermobacter gelatinilyticus TaxID=2582913 RepID=UPI0011072BB7|nr:quinone-dependent dihydroorotate dehydrogenase [Luteithermobacter gelatinilyticus]